MRALVTSAVVGMVVAVLSIGPVAAGGDDHDHDRARAALERGEVLPLRTILDKVEREHPGKVVEVELEREHGRWIYEIRLLRSGGALVRLDVDARDGSVLGVRSRDGKGGKR
ncbi:Peptidase propeptide and YPEB domain protein [Azoarcus sp. Aa7]|nr:Peptidase propeptide and YPEB domain protein [Azoarcus sp. Aa7]